MTEIIGDEMMDEEEPSTSHQGALQTGRGEDDERPFYVDSLRQVYTKKFRTNARSYRVLFTNVFANVEIASLHEQLHGIFQQVLDKTVGGVRRKIRYVSSFIPTSWTNPFIFRSCRPSV